jgi:hypothetical protein
MADLATLAPAFAELPAGWELLYLGYDHGERFSAWDRVKQATYLPLAALRLIKWTPRQVVGLHSRPFSPHLRRAGKHHGTHAYAVSLSGAKHLLEAQTPVASNADQLLIRLCIGGEIVAFVTEPKLFDQESTLGSTGSYISEQGDRTRISTGALSARGATRTAAREPSEILRHLRGRRDDSAGPAGAEGSPAAAAQEHGLVLLDGQREPDDAITLPRREDLERGPPEAVAEEPPGELAVVARGAEDRIDHAAEVERIALPEAGLPE